MIKSLQNISKKRVVAATALVAMGLAGTVGTALAAPVSFGFDAGGGFVVGSASSAYSAPVTYSGFQSLLDPTPANIRASLEWGNPADATTDRSGATINQLAPFTQSPGTASDLAGTVVANGPRQGLGYLVHHNHVALAPPPLMCLTTFGSTMEALQATFLSGVATLE